MLDDEGKGVIIILLIEEKKDELVVADVGGARFPVLDIIGLEDGRVWLEAITRLEETEVVYTWLE